MSIVGALAGAAWRHRTWKVPLLMLVLGAPIALGCVCIIIAQQIGRLPH
jgi:hypothetical protein